jgi:Arc/MetJ-type ribon-helix-helix transcriptional regulator
MAIQLTPEQEQRIEAFVKSGAYGSAQEALDAAVTAVEAVASPMFEGSEEELEALLMEGLSSRELSEEEFWESFNREADAVCASLGPVHVGENCLSPEFP